MRPVLPALLVLVALLAPSAPAAPPQPVPQVASGFTISVFAAIGVPTAIEWGPDDGDGADLYATTLTGNVVKVDVAWTPAGPVATSAPATYAAGFSSPLGLAFDGDVLYVADSHAGAESGRSDGRVTRVDPDGTRTVVVDGLPNGRHNTNHLRFAPDGRLGITNGNPNDNGIDGGDADVHPYSGAILLVDVDVVSASPAVLRWKDGSGNSIAPEDIPTHPVNADFASKVEVLGYGFRNVFGVAWSPAGHAYTATNGADTPSSQDALFKITPGADHGFPRCFHEGAPGAVGSAITIVPSPVFPGADCTSVADATALLGWHVCATGIDFPTASGDAAFPEMFRNSAYVGECGPFFPEPTEKGFTTHDTGHKVARVVLDANGEAVEVVDFITGLALPTDVRFGPDGAMYVADAEGVWRVAPVVVPVAAAGLSFLPAVVTIPHGATVEWNGVLLPHTVTTSASPLGALQRRANDGQNADGNPDTFSRSLGMGFTVRHTFTEPGTYSYYCSLHAGMVGTVVVA